MLILANVLIFGKSAYFRMYRISNLRCTLYPIDSNIQSCIIQFLKNYEKWILSNSMLKKYMLFILPKSSPSQNKHIFVKAKRLCLFLEMGLFSFKKVLIFFQKRAFEKIKFLLLKFIHFINRRVIGIDNDRNFQSLPKFVHIAPNRIF